MYLFYGKAPQVLRVEFKKSLEVFRAVCREKGIELRRQLVRAVPFGPLLAGLLLSAPASAAEPAAPLVIGDTFTIASRVLGETRRINVYRPPGYDLEPAARVPVLYMPDGGIGEDFLHVAGLVQVGAGNGTMRPFLLVGIENTARRRDLTGPTSDPEDAKIAPRVGGSAAFRKFLATELFPEIAARYRITDESALVGESLAGLFVVETFLLEPELFDTYLAFNPSLWWNREGLVTSASERLKAAPRAGQTIFLATSREPSILEPVLRFVETLRTTAPPGLVWHYLPLPEESHGTVYHPAALAAFRRVFKP